VLGILPIFLFLLSARAGDDVLQGFRVESSDVELQWENKFRALPSPENQREEVGTLFVNTDQIVAISAGQNATELQMSDGRTVWTKDTLDEVVSLARNSA
jgi:hypothetical protein